MQGILPSWTIFVVTLSNDKQSVPPPLQVYFDINYHGISKKKATGKVRSCTFPSQDSEADPYRSVIEYTDSRLWDKLRAK